MTNLSKELCEVCGIEPIYETEVVDGWGNTRYKLKCKTPEEAEVKGMFVHREPKYPDFEQAENFVKLFNTRIPNPYITVAGFVTHFALSILATHDFLKRLVQLLKDKPHGCIKSEVEQIKQAIRKEEWIYG